MARYEMRENEIIRYEGKVIARSYKGWKLEATLTSQRLILENKRGVFQKTYDLVGSIPLNTVKVVGSEAQVSRKWAVVSIQADSAEVVLEFPGRSEAKKFEKIIVDAVVRARHMQSSETRDEPEAVGETTAMQEQGAVQQKDSADSSYVKASPTPQDGKKQKKKGKKRWLLIVGALLLVAIAAAYRNFPALPEPVQEAVKKILPESMTQKLHPWDSMVLKDLLPEPPTRVKEIHYNREDLLDVDLKNMSDVQFSAYVQELKKMGYVEFASESSSEYEAYNADGYKVEIQDYDSVGWDAGLTLTAPGERNTQWPSEGLAAMLPPPVASNIKVNKNSEEELTASLELMKQDAYKEFVVGCKEAGFTEASDEDDDKYCAYSTDGYYLEVVYSSYWHQADVSMKAPMKMTQLVWPERGPAKLLPTPNYEEGKIICNDAEQFTVYVAGVWPDEYSAYVDRCGNRGFAVDFSRNDVSYHAYNVSGYELYVTYEYGNIMRISISAPEPKATATPQPTNTPKPTDTPKPANAQKLTVGDTTAYDFALVRKESGYDQYYLLDYDSKTAVCFSTNGESLLEGKMSGTMRPQLKITFSAGGSTWSESMKYKSGSSTVVVMTDQNGNDWEFAVTDVATAMQHLPGAEAESTDWVNWTAKPQATSTPKSDTNLVDGMRPEFKKAMDEYEKFFDDYVELMKKLEKNPNDLTLALEYAQFMIQYDKTMKALEAWEDDNLNNKEMNYYITVTNRINKKLLEVAQ